MSHIWPLDRLSQELQHDIPTHVLHLCYKTKDMVTWPYLLMNGNDIVQTPTYWLPWNVKYVKIIPTQKQLINNIWWFTMYVNSDHIIILKNYIKPYLYSVKHLVSRSKDGYQHCGTAEVEPCSSGNPNWAQMYPISLQEWPIKIGTNRRDPAQKRNSRRLNTRSIYQNQTRTVYSAYSIFC